MSSIREHFATPPDGRDIGTHGMSKKGGDCFSEKYPESTYEDPVPDPGIRLPPDTRVGLILLKPILQHYNDYRCKYSPPTSLGQDRDGQRDTTESSETWTSPGIRVRLVSRSEVGTDPMKRGQRPVDEGGRQYLRLGTRSHGPRRKPFTPGHPNNNYKR